MKERPAGHKILCLTTGLGTTTYSVLYRSHQLLAPAGVAPYPYISCSFPRPSLLGCLVPQAAGLSVLTAPSSGTHWLPSALIPCLDPYGCLSVSVWYGVSRLADSSLFLLCSGTCRATVHVRVNDVNEFAPVFVERLYRAAVTEGKLYDRILRVEAIDGDCSPQYSQICYYEILTPNTPFLIDNDGECSPCIPHPLGHSRAVLSTSPACQILIAHPPSQMWSFCPRRFVPRFLLHSSPVPN